MKKLIPFCALLMMFLLLLIDPGYSQVEEKQNNIAQQEPRSLSNEPPLDIVLVLDNSGSMKKNDPAFLTREVVTNFVNGLQFRVFLIIGKVGF